jgi:mannuronan 5-epimerase
MMVLGQLMSARPGRKLAGAILGAFLGIALAMPTVRSTAAQEATQAGTTEAGGEAGIDQIPSLISSDDLPAASADDSSESSVDGIPAPSVYDVQRSAAAVPVVAPSLPDISGFTVSAVRAMIPPQIDGKTAKLEPGKILPFLSLANILDMSKLWEEQGDSNPQAVVLSGGVFDLDRVVGLLGHPEILQKQGDGIFLLRRPLIISPTATLVIQQNTWLRLEVDAGVMVVNNGTIIMADSRLTSWSEKEQGYGTRSEDSLPDNEILFLGRSRPRPYYLAQSGSKTFMANSEIAGLGYKGERTFGLSFASGPNGTGLKRLLTNQARPTGWLIGNRIHDLFFGLYTNEADDLVVVANEFFDNLIYAIDPHDYSERLIIARNITRGSRHAHGIIISRSVNNSWIFQNIAFGNAGSGIMLDRSSEHNIVADNLAFDNGGNGITVQESSNNRLFGNTVYSNARNGVYIRNSRNVSVEGNKIYRNGKSGVEVGIVDINYLETRNFELDPFEAHVSATISANDFRSNVSSAISVKDADRLSIASDNSFRNSGPLIFSGDLEYYGAKLSEMLFLGSAGVDIVKRPPAEASRAQDPAAENVGRN